MDQAERGNTGTSWRRAGLVGLAFWLCLVPLSRSPRHSGNVWSRYMTIESLVERQTLAVERSPLRPISGSPDLVKFGQHLYSDKPPLLSALTALVYAPLYLSGVRMAGSAPQFVTANWVLVAVAAAGGSALAVAGLRKLLGEIPIPPIAADALAFGFGLGSLLLSYGVTFNNHSVAAGLITCAWALAVTNPGAWRPARREAMIGLLAGLAAAIDLPAGGATLIAMAAWSMLATRRIPWAIGLGAAGPLIAHAMLQTLSTGSPLPAEMTPQLFQYEGSYWNTETGKFAESGPRFWFGLELLFGPQGWLTVSPVLALGIWGLGWAALRRGDRARPSALAGLGVVAALVAFYTWGVRRTDFAGLSFGCRHLLAISPLVFAFAVDGVARLGRRGAWMAFLVLAGMGFVYSYAGMIDPWSRVERRDDSGLAVVKRLTLYPWSSYRR